MALCDMSTGRMAHGFQLERGLSAALDQVMETLAILDAKEGAIIYRNPTFSRTFIDPRSLIPKPRLMDLFRLDEERRILALALEQARSGKSWTGHVFLQTQAGQGISFEGSISPVRNPIGDVESLAVRLREISPGDEKDRHLRLDKKMGALGALAGGVAHDFNNLIGAILNSAELIMMQIEPDSPIREKVELIQRVGDRAKELTAQILNFSRRAHGNWSPIDFTNLVTEVANLLQATLPGSVLVRSELAHGIRVLGDPSQLHQVIMNLGINASQAMQPRGGTLSIQLRCVSVNQGAADPTDPQSCVQLTVEDTGCGMGPQTLERIFEPFFTTKGEGHGTGLGLSVVYDIIQGHGGNLQVSSEPGQGSCFRIFLPVYQDRRQGQKERTAESHSSSLF